MYAPPYVVAEENAFLVCSGLRVDISGLVRTSGWRGRCESEDFHRAGLQSGHTRDSSLAVAAGGPQRW